MATAYLIPPTTPPDYHRIVSPTLTIPSDVSVSVPVGLLACQRDPLLRSLGTVVVHASVVKPDKQSAKALKGSKKAVISPDIPNEPLLHVLLHDTVIFPEGGGQPTDTGVITTADGTPWEVLQSKRHGGHAVHYVKLASNVDIDATLLAFSPGSKVLVSLAAQDYDRRYDHMSMHTSQHLLSALLEAKLNLPTLSWSLTGSPSPCYVEIPRGITEAEVALVQAEANRLVFEGRRVHVEVEELDSTTEPQDTPVLQSGRAVGKALPADYTGGVKRVVVIDGVDRNPCCGTHLPSIHNLQLFLFPHTETLARSSTTSARLYFLSGPRLITYLTSAHSYLTNTAATLSCGPPQVPQRVTQVIEERKKADKRVNDMEQELATEIGNDLACKIRGSCETPLFKKHIHRTDDSNNVLGFLSSIALSVGRSATGLDGRSYLIILSSSPSSQNSSSLSTVLVFGSEDAKVKAAGDAIRTKLGVKGGGKGPRWSGKFTGVWKESATLKAVLDDL